METDVNFSAMKHTLTSIWHPMFRIIVQKWEEDRFLFIFYNHIDMERVIDGSLWTFENKILLFEVLEVGDRPSQMPLNSTSMWLQIYGIPVRYMSEVVGMRIGNGLGAYMKSDPNNFTGGWREYMRI